MKKFFYPLAIITTIVFFVFYKNLTSEWVTILDTKASALLKGNSFIEFFHYFGETKLIMIVAVLLLIWLWIRDRNYRGMVFALLTIAVGNTLNHLMKDWVQRPRPIIPHQLTSFSFPSGHAMVGTLYLFTIAYLTTEYSSKKKKIVVWSITIILAALVGLSRIAGSRHFASDVIAGWCIGYTWFILVVIWYERRKRTIERHVKKSS